MRQVWKVETFRTFLYFEARAWDSGLHVLKDPQLHLQCVCLVCPRIVKMPFLLTTFRQMFFRISKLFFAPFQSMSIYCGLTVCHLGTQQGANPCPPGPCSPVEQN